MKLIIQIPCYNEEETLPITYADFPRSIPGIDVIETLIIDDGSSDKTVEVAKRIGINHIVKFNRNKGLAYAFSAGIEKCLELGADIIVNTDGDNQYCGYDIEQLVRPVLEKKADMVIGDRQTDKISHFAWYKKLMQKYGSMMIRKMSDTDVNDAVSGFRAYSREAAIKMNIISDFSYTVENIIQFGHQKIKIVSVPIRTNGKLRESRLFKNIPSFVYNQARTILRVYSTYNAINLFSLVGFIVILPGLYGFLRYLYFFIEGSGKGHIQSLLVSTICIIIGFIIFMFGVIADLVSNNRKLIEKNIELTKKIYLKMDKDK